jgi:hypothetical protein
MKGTLLHVVSTPREVGVGEPESIKARRDRGPLPLRVLMRRGLRGLIARLKKSLVGQS